RSQGGPTAFKNLCLACPSCNRHKSNRTVGLTNHGIETRLFHPQLDVWQNHFEWSVDGTLIVAITDIGNATIHSLKMNRPQLISLRALWVIVGKHPPDRA
ncbi:MAG: HNH endonuclease, partial [bacterium]